MGCGEPFNGRDTGHTCGQRVYIELNIVSLLSGCLLLLNLVTEVIDENSSVFRVPQGLIIYLRTDSQVLCQGTESISIT